MCGAGVSGAHILANGDVVGCPFMPRTFATGNVRETRFSEIWERGFASCRQRGWTKSGPCAKCKDYADCRGGCLLRSGLAGGLRPARVHSATAKGSDAAVDRLAPAYLEH